MTIHQQERYGDQVCVIDLESHGRYYIARPRTVDAEGNFSDILNDEGLAAEFESDSPATAYKRAELFLIARFGRLGGRTN